MNKKKVNIAKKNSEKTKLNHTKSIDKDKIPETISQLENSEDRVRLSKSKIKRNYPSIKPMITASISAILIGTVLGLVLLSIFTDTEDKMTQDANNVAAVHANPDDEDDTQLKANKVTLKAMGAYVLQVGVFTEKANADEWANTYNEQGFPATIMQRDNQYFLFAGIADTKEGAEQLALTIEEQELDVFVKEWVINETDTELTEEEHRWIKSFQDQWEKALQSISKQEGLLTEGWSDLINDFPVESKEIAQLVEVITTFYENDFKEAKGLEPQNILLNIWQEYEVLIK